MKIKLGKNAYGKNAVNLSKIIRHNDHHEFKQVSVNVALEGDFETAHTVGDNTKILPTDTQKNTVYVLAKDHLNSSIEEFALYLSNHFLSNNEQVSGVKIEITEHLWTSLNVDGRKHPHAYISRGSEKHTVVTRQDRFHATADVVSGISDLLILKTTDSGFENYIKDNYTTLKETSDRILSTNCEVSWVYNSVSVNFDLLYTSIRHTLLETFANHKSLSVQHTLHDMGEAVLKKYDDVKEISFIMPNKHHIPFNLEPFGMENRNEIFIATDEPYGYITGTITRE